MNSMDHMNKNETFERSLARSLAALQDAVDAEAHGSAAVRTAAAERALADPGLRRALDRLDLDLDRHDATVPVACQQTRHYLEDLELDPEDSSDVLLPEPVQTHLQTCADCGWAWDEMRTSLVNDEAVDQLALKARALFEERLLQFKVVSLSQTALAAGAEQAMVLEGAPEGVRLSWRGPRPRRPVAQLTIELTHATESQVVHLRVEGEPPAGVPWADWVMRGTWSDAIRPGEQREVAITQRIATMADIQLTALLMLVGEQLRCAVSQDS